SYVRSPLQAGHTRIASSSGLNAIRFLVRQGLGCDRNAILAQALRPPDRPRGSVGPALHGAGASSLYTPSFRNRAARLFTSSLPDTPESASRFSISAALSVAAAAAGSRWAPPTGSGSTPSTMSSASRSGAARRSASAALDPCLPSRHRIEAQPSGEITE